MGNGETAIARSTRWPVRWPSQGRDAGIRIDEMRGLAALLVVVFHAIGGDPELTTSFLGHATQSLAFVRLPLFIAISGYLYGLQRRTRPLTMAGWWKRTSRILPPFLLGTVICWAMSAGGGYRFDLTSGLIYGAWHLWYLQSMVVILLVVTVLETVVRPANRHLPLWTAGAFLVVSIGLFSETTWLSIHKAANLLPHFLTGVTLGAMPGLLENRRFRVTVYTLGIVALVCNEVSLAGIGPLWTRTSLVAALLGVASFVTLALHMPVNTTLRRLGAYSLPIFLWHLPLSAVASFLVLNRIGLEAHLTLAVKIVVGTTVPIAMSMIVARTMPALIVFVGKRSATRAPAAEPVPSVVGGAAVTI